MNLPRRLALSAAVASLAVPALARAARVLPPMTDGPFYPPRRWRQTFADGGDWDADLTRARPASGRPAASTWR
jgi:protocatechuate 3,4-dioxygenase beta subunit